MKIMNNHEKWMKLIYSYYNFKYRILLHPKPLSYYFTNLAIKLFYLLNKIK